MCLPDNSTQVYYIEVQIEAGAYDNFTKLLNEFNRIPLDVNYIATVTNFSITTGNQIFDVKNKFTFLPKHELQLNAVK